MSVQNFDICVPTWNSLSYLKNLIEGIRLNSAFKHRVIVHDNGSTDGTEEWLWRESQCFHDNPIDNIVFTRSEENKGFCGVNNALKLATEEHVMLFNADMWPLKNWDMAIVKQINNFKRKGIDKYTISSSLIEPTGNNPEYIIRNFGTTVEEFDSKTLLMDYQLNSPMYFAGYDTIQYSHPILMPRKFLASVDYMDPAYFPGWASDHDLASKLFNAGCIDFVMLKTSRVYHFVSKTFKQLPENVRNRDGQDIFARKWGMSVEQFRQKLNIKGRY